MSAPWVVATWFYVLGALLWLFGWTVGISSADKAMRQRMAIMSLCTPAWPPLLVWMMLRGIRYLIREATGKESA